MSRRIRTSCFLCRSDARVIRLTSGGIRVGLCQDCDDTVGDTTGRRIGKCACGAETLMMRSLNWTWQYECDVCFAKRIK